MILPPMSCRTSRPRASRVTTTLQRFFSFSFFFFLIYTTSWNDHPFSASFRASMQSTKECLRWLPPLRTSTLRMASRPRFLLLGTPPPHSTSSRTFTAIGRPLPPRCPLGGRKSTTRPRCVSLLRNFFRLGVCENSLHMFAGTH